MSAPGMNTTAPTTPFWRAVWAMSGAQRRASPPAVAGRGSVPHRHTLRRTARPWPRQPLVGEVLGHHIAGCKAGRGQPPCGTCAPRLGATAYTAAPAPALLRRRRRFHLTQSPHRRRTRRRSSVVAGRCVERDPAGSRHSREALTPSVMSAAPAESAVASRVTAAPSPTGRLSPQCAPRPPPRRAPWRSCGCRPCGC